MMRRLTVCLLASALITLAGAVMPTMENAHAAGLNTRMYVNAANSYRFAFPAEWNVLKANGLNCLLQATDGDATIAAKSMPGTGAVLDVLRSQATTIMGYGSVQGKINVTKQLGGGMEIAISDAVVMVKGKRLDIQQVDVLHGGFTYEFSAVVRLDLANTSTHLHEISVSYNSIQVR